MFKRVSFLSLSAAILLTVSSSAKVVTETAAQKIAKDFMTSNGLAQKELVLFESNDIPPALRAPSLDSPAYHIFRDAEGTDLIVVAGDDIALPILGFSFGHKGDGNGDLPPAMKEWLDEIEKQILQARKEGLAQSAEIARQWADPGVGNVVKQLSTAKWNQYAPYNWQCPIKDGKLCITGCTATSIAILLRYYGIPSSGKGITPAYSYPNKDVFVASRNLNHPYYWDSMPLELTEFGVDFTYEQADSIAQLMADIGAALQADYSTDETTAKYNKGALFKHFGISMGGRKNKADFTTDEWNTMLKNSLDNNRPVLYTGNSSEGLGAHSFIIDGYTDQDYFCINWGWGGQYDGAFALDALDLSWIDYHDEQAAYFDFQEANDLPVVAIVDDTIQCPSLDAALGMVPYNGWQTNIKMVKNSIIDESSIKTYQNVVLDLNGFNIDIENYGLYNNGTLVIKDGVGSGKVTIAKGNTEILSNYGVMTIEGGEFINEVELSGTGKDYRRCIWSDAGSITHIKGGKFTCNAQVVCTRGRLIIDDGEFESTGNSNVICNYALSDTVFINGGTIKNITTPGETSNNRHAVWSTTGSTTYITGGDFSSNVSVVYSYGNLTVDDGVFESYGNNAVLTHYAQSDTITINGGSFKNLSIHTEGTNYRRCIWTTSETTTRIYGGQFKSTGQVICTNGKLTIDDGEFESIGNGDVIANNAIGDSVIIRGGSFKNLSKTGNYRICVRAKEGSTTYISNGDFVSAFSAIYTQGKVTIDGGYFESSGNTCAISNYSKDTLTINGGVFKNTLTESQTEDYRRALWSDKGSTTIINDGDFSSDYQVVTFNGKATINGGTIVNIGNGEGCRSAGNVVINDCKLKAKTLLYLSNGSSLKCYGGLYSQSVTSKFIGSGYRCVSNNDPATKTTYPYKIEKNPNAIHNVTDQKDTNEVHYDLNGRIRSNKNESGIHIIRKADGKTEKVLYK